MSINTAFTLLKQAIILTHTLWVCWSDVAQVLRAGIGSCAEAIQSLRQDLLNHNRSLAALYVSSTPSDDR